MRGHSRQIYFLTVAALVSGCLNQPRYVYNSETNPVTSAGSAGASGSGPGSGSGTGAGTGTSTPAIPQLMISPASINIGVAGTAIFVGSGGVPPYTFTSSGGETIDAAGRFMAGTGTGARQITIHDSAGNVAVAQLTIVVPNGVTPNDPLLGQETSMTKNIAANAAWGISINCRPKIVAVTDTGVDLTQPDLAPNIWTNPSPTPGMNDTNGYNFVGNNNNPTDQNYHGTHVAGTIGAAGNNGRGVAGVCWQANIVPVRFLDQDGSGTVSDAVEALDYSLSIKAKIINASWGIDAPSQTLSDAVKRVSDSGALLIAAAGNGDVNGNGINIDTSFSAPASYDFPGVIGVAAVDDNDVIAGFSNFGTGHVVIAAPGVNVLSTFPNFRTQYAIENNLTFSAYMRLDGTSMAAPHVSGAIALLWSLYPNWTAAQIKTRLLNQADKIPGIQGKVLNGNRLNVKRMLVD